MRKLFNTLAAATALGVVAIASSPAVSQPVPFSWTGAYVGGNAGASFHSSSSAFSGGGQIGYTYQVNPTWVLGVEADLQAAKIRTQTTSATQAFPTSVTGAPLVCRIENPFLTSRPNGVDLTDPNSGLGGVVNLAFGSQAITTPEQCATLFNFPAVRATLGGAFGAVFPATSIVISPSSVSYSLAGALDWFGTLRGRLGFQPANGFLLYVTGGLAFGEAQLALATTTGTTRIGISPTFAPTTTTFSTFMTAQDRILLGYAIGGGAEYAFHRNWSVKGEYLYVDLGEAGIGTQSVSFKTSVARFGINYRFAAAQ